MFFLHLRGEISKNYQGYRLPLGWLRLRCFGLWKKVCPLWTIPIQTIHHRLIQQIVQKSKDGHQHGVPVIWVAKVDYII